MAPLVGAYTGLSPELLVLATASGAVMLSLQSLLSLGGILLLSTVIS